ncbi:arginine repressor, partial [Veillonella sp. R32]
KWGELIGTLAGDDTILLIARSVEDVQPILKRISDLMKD